MKYEKILIILGVAISILSLCLVGFMAYEIHQMKIDYKCNTMPYDEARQIPQCKRYIVGGNE